MLGQTLTCQTAFDQPRQHTELLHPVEVDMIHGVQQHDDRQVLGWRVRTDSLEYRDEIGQRIQQKNVGSRLQHSRNGRIPVVDEVDMASVSLQNFLVQPAENPIGFGDEHVLADRVVDPFPACRWTVLGGIALWTAALQSRTYRLGRSPSFRAREERFHEHRASFKPVI